MENAGEIVSQYWGLVMQIVNIATAPFCGAVLLAIGSTQAVKMIAHRLPWFRRRTEKEKLRRGEIWLLAWVMTGLTFPVMCWVMGVPVQANLPLGFIAGAASPFLPFLLKKIGLDLDKVLKTKHKGN